MCAVAFMLLELPRLSAAAEQWTATSTTNAPSARTPGFAFWTGTKMIVWGGRAEGPTLLNTGGIYDPTTDTWTTTSTAGVPTYLRGATAVWTGSKMIVWGGYDGVGYPNTGAIYDPLSDTWAPTSTVGAPSGREDHSAVWTGSKMIVWGGLNDDGLLGTGGIYDPDSGTWTATSMVAAPAERANHHAVWTGSKMIVWGGGDDAGFLRTGRIYDPETDTWTTMNGRDAPSDAYSSTAVWTGSEMIIWGGFNDAFLLNSGAVYDLAANRWRPTATDGAPSPRENHTAVWTGSRMIIWGGFGGDVYPIFDFLNTGGIYDPSTDTWVAETTTVGAPSPRESHTAVWTGSKLIVWGGSHFPDVLDTGGLYTPPGEPAQGPLVAGTERVFPLVSHCGIPDGARSLSVNLAVTQPTTGGHLRLYAAGAPLPTVSSINYSAGQTRANNAIATLNVSGELAVWCAQPSGTVDFILDVSGYFDASGHFFTLTPCRLVDTRAP
jgi:N-acetylneuraminic acid mutarotase